MSKIVHLNVLENQGKEPYEYEPILRQNIPDYDK